MRSRGYLGRMSLALAALAVAGCGRSGGSGEEAEARSPAEFVKAASALCKRSREVTGRRLETAKTWAAAGAGMTRALRERVIRFMVVSPAESLSRELQRLAPIRGGDRRLEAYPETLARDASRARSHPFRVAAGTAFVASDTIANERDISACVH